MKLILYFGGLLGCFMLPWVWGENKPLSGLTLLMICQCWALYIIEFIIKKP